MATRKVYIVNKSSHDFTPAKEYGEIEFLSEGLMNRYHTTDIIRTFAEAMSSSNEDDLIVLCSLNVMNALACSIFAAKHRKINLLLYKDGRYIERNHVL